MHIKLISIIFSIEVITIENKLDKIFDEIINEVTLSILETKKYFRQNNTVTKEEKEVQINS